MRNTLAPTVQIELFRSDSEQPSVLGTDCVVHIDGRWSQYRATQYVEDMAREASARRGLEWRRTVYLLGGRYRSVKV